MDTGKSLESACKAYAYRTAVQKAVAERRAKIASLNARIRIENAKRS